MENIVVKNIIKSFGERRVLDVFSASFAYGRSTAIMGDSGCGKTTLLRILTGLDKEFSGTVEGMPERFSYVFQENRLCEQFSVYDNVNMVLKDEKADSTGAHKDKASRDKDRTKHIEVCLSDLGIAEFMHCKVSDLSGGQKRRVAIARAIMYDSDLLIMDEPFTGLDENTKKIVANAILKQKKTVIMVTHDPDEAFLMDASILKMNRPDPSR